MLTYFLENRLTYGGESVTLTRRAPFTPKKITGTHFCYRLSRLQGHSAAGRIRSIEKSNCLIGNRTRDLPACSIVPQPRAPRRWKESVQINVFCRDVNRTRTCAPEASPGTGVWTLPVVLAGHDEANKSGRRVVLGCHSHCPEMLSARTPGVSPIQVTVLYKRLGPISVLTQELNMRK
jgi:hypothetical protein